MTRPPGRPDGWRGPLTELDRWEWDGAGDPGEGLGEFLTRHGLSGPPHAHPSGRTAVALLVGALGAAALAGLPAPRASPVAVPELVAVAVTAGGGRRRPGAAAVGSWEPTWSDAKHAGAVRAVQAAIGRGEVYQANVVGHRSARYTGDPAALAARVSGLRGATYGGVLAGDGWTVGCASPEQLVRVVGRRVTTVPVKGTMAVGPGAARRLRASRKDRAEHVMIVDLERNDLSRVAVTGSVDVERLYALRQWSGLWQASSTVAAELRPDVGVVELLRAVLPGGSVTGAPKRSACALLAGLEPVGRGPAMGALGFVHPGGLDLGLTIRSIALDRERVHLWAGGGITWGSEPDDEVAEAHAKAAPLLAALAQPPAERAAAPLPSTARPGSSSGADPAVPGGAARAGRRSAAGR